MTIFHFSPEKKHAIMYCLHIISAVNGEFSFQNHTVDVRNPANQLIWRINQYLQAFSTIPGG